MRLSYTALLSLLGLALIVSCVVALSFGAAALSPHQVIGIIGERLFGVTALDPDWTNGQSQILWVIRAPRILLGALVGAGLAVVGCALQATTRNPLADPHLLGVSSGAAFGAVLVMLYLGEFAGMFSLPLGAFAGALASLMLVLTIAGRLESERLLLGGVAVSFLLVALSNLMLFMSNPHAANAVLFWMLGGLGLARWELLWLPALCLALVFPTLLGMSRALNALLTGEQGAVSLGLPPNRVRLTVFVTTSLLTGVLVALSGAIGFVGLMLPHVARRLVGADHRRLLPVSAFLGALFLVWADVIARCLMAPQDLPIGVVTAACGGLFFILILRHRR